MQCVVCVPTTYHVILLCMTDVIDNDKISRSIDVIDHSTQRSSDAAGREANV